MATKANAKRNCSKQREEEGERERERERRELKGKQPRAEGGWAAGAGGEGS